MPFIPLSASFPRVSSSEQSARDADAEQILLAEFAQDMPDENRAALEAEYQQRFGKEPPPVQRGFIPLANAGTAMPQRGFTPLDSGDAAGPSTVQRAAMAAEPYVTPALKTVQAVASGYPVAETAANLLTMGAALPAAGLAGIGTAAARMFGLTDKEPADVVHAVSNALTYQPKTELGQHLTGAAMYPFEMLAKGGAAAGDKVLDATGSPIAATAVDTTINALPMAIAPAAKGIQTARARFAPTVEPVQIDPVAKVGLATTPDEMIAAIGELRQSIDGTMDILQSLPPIPEIMPPAIPRAIVPAPGMPSAGLAPSGMIAPTVNAGARPGFIPTPDVAMVQRPAIAEAPAVMPPAAMEAAPRPALAPAPVKAPSPAELVAEPRPAPGIEATPQIQRGFIPLENIDAQPIPAGIRRLAPDDQAMLGPDRQGLEALRGPGRDGLPAVAEQLRDLPPGRGPETIAGPVALAGEARNPGELRAGERGLAEAPAADFASAVLPPDTARAGAVHRGDGSSDRLASDNPAKTAVAAEARPEPGTIPGAAALPEKLEVPDPRRADLERAGMGDAVGREGADPAREAASGIAAGTGVEAGRPEKAGIPAGEGVSDSGPTVVPKIDVALDDIPPALLNRVNVSIDRLILDDKGRGSRESFKVPAKQALAELDEEAGAYRNLLGDMQGGANLVNGISKWGKEFLNFDKEEVIEAASEYRTRGLTGSEAGIRAVEDHLRGLDWQKRTIVDELIVQFRQRDPEGYAMRLETMKTAAIIERPEPSPVVTPLKPPAEPKAAEFAESPKPAEPIPAPEVVAAPDARIAEGMAETRTGESATVREEPAREPARTVEPIEQPAAAGFVPLRDSIDAAAHDAAASPLNGRPQPTPAQIEAGNYRKGAVRLHGMAISIENPAGSIRRGTDASGRAWETEMQHHYGYIKNSLAKDGDHVDVFIGKRPETPRAFVIDQIDPKTGKYDEPKVIMGARNEAEARRIYQANYEPGWKGLGAITEMEMGAFKEWVKSNDTTKPVGLPRILGKSLTEYSDAALSRFASQESLPKSARVKVEAEMERRRDTPAGAAAEPVRTQILGRPISKMSDAQLENWSKSSALPEKTRAKVDAEIERRATSADSSAEPVRAQIAETGSDSLLKDAEVQDMAAAKVQNGTWNPGANYAPFVDQMRAPEAKAKSVTDLPAPKRRENIIKRFAKEIGTTVYEGRIKGEKRLGFFRPKVEEVRTKHANDIEVAAHEVAHLIDHRVPELAQAWRADKVLREELKSVSYDQKNVREGFAEGVRLFLTQPETLEAKAPKVYAWLNDFADSHKYGPALRQAQADMTAWFGQDALNRARSKIGTEKPMAEYFDNFWKGFRQSTVDDLDGIYRMERDLTGKVSENGPYESARLSRASASIADGAVRFGYPVKAADGSFKFAGKGLEEIMKPVSKNIDDALLYFVGRSAQELLLQNREHLFTRGEIDAMLKLKTPERAKAFEEYQAWNKGILDFAEAQGIINPEARRLWQRTQYMPFHRVDQPGGIKGKPGDWAGIQALTGGTTNIKDVMGNMIGNAAMLIDKSVKNEARLKVARLSQLGGGKFMVKIDAESRPVKISGDQVIDAMLKKYGIAIDGDAPAFFEFLIKGQPPAGNNVVAVMQGGKPVWFEVGDPILYRALKAVDRPVQSEVVRWLGLPKRIGQLTITATPDFWMANIARDTLMGSVMSRAGFRPIIDSLQGMTLRLTKDPLYRDYLANGGGLSSIFLEEKHLRTKLESYYRDQGIDYRTVLDTPDKILTMVETLGDAFEMSTRLGEYRRAIERGENPRHAAYMGREVSTDFAMKGDSKALGFMYDTVMFLRPALVSWDRLYRGLAHDPNKGAIAAKAGMMALSSAGLYLLNRDDPRYKDLPDWDRDANWHFFIGDQHFRWPKIWEIGALSSAAERTVEKIMDEDPQGLGKDFLRIMRATFSVNFMPQIIAPLAEQATNRNGFTTAPIETPGMENVQPFLRAKPGTSETMKAIGMATRDMPEALQVNPVRAEALLRGYFNTYALYGLMLSDQALFKDKLPEKRTDELPVVRRFYSQEPAKHTKYETVFYDLLQESKRLRGTMRELDEMGLRGYADAKEKEPLATEAKPLERAAKSLGVINNEVQAVRRNVDLTPAEKRQKLDALTVERNALVKAAVTESKAAQKERDK